MPLRLWTKKSPTTFISRRAYAQLYRIVRSRDRLGPSPAIGMDDAEPSKTYSEWSHEQLVKRVARLERHLRALSLSSQSSPSPISIPRKKEARPFDPSKFNTRFIALKFAYLGQRYNGYENHANNRTPLPTIEEELWKALAKTRLIMPKEVPDLRPGEVNWEGCDYSKCGRTDKGVSAFGQVIGIRVRSKRPLSARTSGSTPNVTEPKDLELESEAHSTSPESQPEDSRPFDHLNDEFPYVRLLNNVLPPDIRVLAWCPSPPKDFSARFSCRERRYKYFFTQPAFAPIPGNSALYPTINGSTNREGWLDIAAMREAAEHFVGVHDFRNFCKLDPSKQIENFKRRIFRASIEEINPLHGPVGYVSQEDFRPPLTPMLNSDSTEASISSTLEPSAANPNPNTPTRSPKNNMHTTSSASHAASEVGASSSNSAQTQGVNRTPALYSFTVHGSAFLWHQVRHLVAILFLVGQGLEKPSIVQDLLDVSKTPSKPIYDIASDAPLVLWDCIFPAEGTDSSEDSLDWIYVSDGQSTGDTKTFAPASERAKYGRHGVMDRVWRNWRRAKIDEVLAGTLLDVVAGQGNRVLSNVQTLPTEGQTKAPKLFDGGDGWVSRGEYIPILKRRRNETIEVLNQRYASRKSLENGNPHAVNLEDADE